MKRYLAIIGALLLIGSIIALEPSFFSASQKVSFGGKTYTLERADTDATRALGLGERDFLCETCGMLFVFERPGKPGFWMKGMRFPLDIIWLLDDQIVHIERHVSEESQETYYPPAPANQVLEFRAGTADNLETGERVEFSLF